MKTFGIIALIILSIILIGIGPILTIMSLNALFALGIGITFWNWLAIVWLSMILGGICGNKFKFK